LRGRKFRFQLCPPPPLHYQRSSQPHALTPVPLPRPRQKRLDDSAGAVGLAGLRGVGSVLAAKPPPPSSPSAKPLPEFCKVPGGPASGKSVFNEVSTDAMHAAAAGASAGNASAVSALAQLMGPLANTAPCFWAEYSLPVGLPDPATSRQPTRKIPMCTHDPTVDTVISGGIHKYGAWLPSFHRELKEHLPGGTCPPDRPVVRPCLRSNPPVPSPQATRGAWVSGWRVVGGVGMWGVGDVMGDNRRRLLVPQPLCCRCWTWA
jgi:hypothetical protein